MEEWEKHCQLINYILSEHDRQQTKILPVKLIDGHDIMTNFNLEAGPLIGRLLAMVNEAHASGELSTREEALALVRKELPTVSKQQTRVAQKPQNSEVKNI
jgi:hypothetical protein